MGNYYREQIRLYIMTEKEDENKDPSRVNTSIFRFGFSFGIS